MTTKKKDPKRVKAGKHGKRKGRRFEQTIARSIREEVERLDLDEVFLVRRGIQARLGRESADVNIIRKIDNRVHVHLECKHRDKINIHEAYQQACDDRFPFAAPIAITRKTGDPILVTMGFDDFKEMLLCWLTEPPKDNF